ncbi:MAG: hypothetical protein RRY53_05015, partial [Pseudoflavonifractor sp.]
IIRINGKAVQQMFPIRNLILHNGNIQAKSPPISRQMVQILAVYHNNSHFSTVFALYTLFAYLRSNKARLSHFVTAAPVFFLLHFGTSPVPAAAS